MKLTDKELTEVFKGLQEGYMYHPVKKNGQIDTYMHIVRAWNDINKTEYCIAYQSYGSSATKNDLESLRWLSENIFDDFDHWTQGRQLGV